MGIEKRGSSTDLHLRTAMEQSPLGTAIVDPDGRYLLVNAAWNALWALEEGGPPKDSSVFENERLRAMGLTTYLEEYRQNGEVTTPILFLQGDARDEVALAQGVDLSCPGRGRGSAGDGARARRLH